MITTLIIFCSLLIGLFAVRLVLYYTKKNVYVIILLPIFSIIAAYASFHQSGLTYEFYFTYFIFLILAVIALIDYYTFRIPNSLLLLLLSLIIAYISLSDQNILIRVISSLCTMLLLIWLNWIYKNIRGIDAIGSGDIKLIASLFLLVEPEASFIGLWLSSIIGLVGFIFIKAFISRLRYETKIPFGFYLSMAFILVKYYEAQILNNYYFIIGIK